MGMCPAAQFTVTVQESDPVVVLAVSGEMDATTTGRLDSALDAAIRDHEHHVVLDVGEVTFIDSTGVTALVSGLRRLNRSRRRMAIACSAGGAVGRSLEVTGLDHTFECHETLREAVDALSGAPLIGR